MMSSKSAQAVEYKDLNALTRLAEAEQGAPSSPSTLQPYSEEAAVLKLRGAVKSILDIDDDKKFENGGVTAFRNFRLAVLHGGEIPTVLDHESSHAPAVLKFLVKFKKRQRRHSVQIGEVLKLLMKSTPWAAALETSPMLVDLIKTERSEDQKSILENEKKEVESKLESVRNQPVTAEQQEAAAQDAGVLDEVTDNTSDRKTQREMAHEGFKQAAEVPRERDDRHDFGLGWRICTQCKSLCLNRGCKESNQVVCITCWPTYVTTRDGLVQIDEATMWDEFSKMKLSEVKQKARDEGIGKGSLDGADATSDPEGAVIQLILEKRKDDEVKKFREELDAMKVVSLMKIAMALGVSEEDLEEAVNSINNKESIIQLILGVKADPTLWPRADPTWLPREILRKMDLPKLKKIAKRLGVEREVVDGCEDKKSVIEHIVAKKDIQKDKATSYKVFLSHTKGSTSWGAEPFVSGLYHFLDSVGIPTFFDLIALPGKGIEFCVEAAEAAAIIVVVLDDTTPTEWMVKEIDAARNKGVPVMGIFRQDKFQFDNIGKNLWKQNKIREELIKYVFHTGAVKFYHDDRIPTLIEDCKALWLKDIYELLGDDKAYP